MFPFIPAAMMGISALSGLFGNKGQTQKSTQNTQTNNQSSFANANSTQSSSAPIIDPRSQSLLSGIQDKYMGLMNNDPNMSGYTAAGIQGINRNSDLQRQNTMENMAQRGQTGPMVGSALNANDAQRFQQVNQFQQSVPLMARQLQQDTLDRAMGVFKGTPQGQYNEGFNTNEGWGQDFGNSASQGTNTLPGNKAGGMLGNLGNMMAFLYGQGAIGGGGGKPTNSAQNFNVIPNINQKA